MKFLLLSLCVASSISGALLENREEIVCAGYAAAAPEGAGERKYAPDREVDILHLKLDVTPDFDRRTVSGVSSMTFKPIARAVQQIRLDAVNLTIRKVESATPIESYYSDDESLTIRFREPIAAGRETTVHVDYFAQPAKGLYFRTPAMGYRPGDTHLFTQGETHEARHWYPAYDYPNEKFTSEVICHVPKGMTVLSNGKLESELINESTGMTTVHWVQDKPHANYLVSLLAGYFKKLEDRHGNVPLSFYVPASEFAQATNSFRDTRDVMAFFDKEIGVPFPWAKYAQVCVNDFHFGGMENTSITTLTDRTLFADESENIHDSHGLVAHEMAHQWFGDYVTCKDWSHVWLNEGFATYYTLLYDEHRNGHDSMLYGLYNEARQFLDAPNDVQPIVFRKYETPEQQFGFHAYPKGSWVLHMLRSQLGPELYRQCIQTYLGRHAFGNVVTEDLNRVIEELSGRSFDPFFDQWVYHAHHPELGIQYAWDASTREARVTVSQNQKLSETVLLFRIPLKIRFHLKDRWVDRDVEVSRKSEDFYFQLPEAPEWVRVDPEFSLLAKISFQPPFSMLRKQIRATNDVMGRVFAVESLAGQKSDESIALLKERLVEDPFWGVRLEASKALRAIQTPEALQALTQGRSQKDARVRRQVVNDVGSFYSTQAAQVLREVLREEKNPEILAAAADDLGPWSSEETVRLLQQLLERPSYRNVVADAAIRAMRAQSNPAFVDSILTRLREHGPDFTTGGYAQGVSALGYLGRPLENQEKVYSFLIDQLFESRETIQVAAIRALGNLENRKAIPILDRFTGSRSRPAHRQAAEQAINAINQAKKPVESLEALRKQLQDLQSENRKLSDGLESLRKKFEGLAAPAPAAAAKENSKPAEKEKEKPSRPKRR